ncbi:MAG: FAD-binding protein [Deltaproteobacteria bacterium]|nr:FAD-binding protein [Deltaproteobacteria bacterium]
MSVTELLISEFGKEKVLFDVGKMQPYSVDESDNPPSYPETVFFPESPLEIEILAKLSSEHGFPVTPRGAGTGKTGGSIPLLGGVVVSMERMNHILDVDEESLFTVIEPGVITEALQNKVKDFKLFYPPDPASLDKCTLGGNVAENAGGPRAFRYGVTREYLLGMEIVNSSGNRFNIGKKSVKGVSGYDLTALICGSEGTLGIISQLTLKLIPLHRPSGIIVAYYATPDDAGKSIGAVLRSGIFPMSLEMMDAASINIVRYIEGFDPPENAGGAVICELEGIPEDPILLRNSLEIIKNSGVIHHEIALTEKEMEIIWEARRKVSSSLKEKYPFKLSEDIAVPRAAISETLYIINDIANKHSINCACYGHAGDGNLHVNFLSDNADESDKLNSAASELFIKICSIGGTLTGEHGIGISKKRFMTIEHDPFSLEMMKGLKSIWDPSGRLNPGKIFD